MPLNENLTKFLWEAVRGMGPFVGQYVTPLRAFLNMEKEPEKIQEVLNRGLTIQSARNDLEKILSEDPFLEKCCGDSEGLAFALDVLFFNRIPLGIFDKLEHSLLDIQKGSFATSIEGLRISLYENGDFSKKAFFHLFNFAASGDQLPPPPYPDWTIQELNHRLIAQILGENTFSSFLSPPETGRFFLIAHDFEGFHLESLSDWLDRRWKDASPFRQILQYAKDGIVDIDYVVPYFNPPWLNQIHRGGVYYSGTPRQHSPSSNLWYLLLPGDSEEIQGLWLLYQKHAEKITVRETTLRKAIGIAGDFYEASHRKIDRIEQFADLIIALEALYTPSDQAESTFRISQSCALMLGNSLTPGEEAEDIFEFLRAMFSKRGKLFHGRYSPFLENPEGFIQDKELLKLISIVRLSILKFLALFLRGETKIEKIRTDLQRAVLDEFFRSEFLEKADMESLLSSEPL